MLDQEYNPKNKESIDYVTFINYSYEVKTLFVEIENLLKLFVIFWEDIKAKNSPANVLFNSAFQITKRYIYIYGKAIEIFNQHYEKRFVDIFYSFVKLIGFRTSEFKKHRHELAQKYDDSTTDIVKIENKLVNIKEDYLLVLLSIENQTFGKIEFVSYQSMNILNYVPLDLIDRSIAHLILPRKLKRT